MGVFLGHLYPSNFLLKKKNSLTVSEKTRNQASIKVEVDSDQSPPRKERSGKETAIKVEVDSDQSPPRKDLSTTLTINCHSSK
ncbi:hypothetical protein ANCCEY_13392 [Ancylostoma ceylanicum]|uniref:Uncharacterized protein n=1 Tax=Ancylostoma ceylanicum TaxID=53326 RepID=A0A0D6L8X2_9BILA|nr:hypothetical protein ANCCEY_13392 [Ancylostoma ceylanicum]